MYTSENEQNELQSEQIRCTYICICDRKWHMNRAALVYSIFLFCLFFLAQQDTQCFQPVAVSTLGVSDLNFHVTFRYCKIFYILRNLLSMVSDRNCFLWFRDFVPCTSLHSLWSYLIIYLIREWSALHTSILNHFTLLLVLILFNEPTKTNYYSFCFGIKHRG